MPQRKPGLYVNLGNLLEIIGGVAFCVGVDLLVGLGPALMAAGVLFVVAAELIYDSTAFRAVPLPSRWPQPRERVRSWRQRVVLWWTMRPARKARQAAVRKPVE